MKHLAQIQIEFLKIAKDWDDLSYEEQKGYLSRHPKTKRKITAKPEFQSTQNDDVPRSKTTIGKINQTSKPKLLDLFNPLFKKHDDYLRSSITDQYTFQRKKFLKQFPIKTKDLSKQVLLLDYPDNEQVKNFVNNDANNYFLERQILKQFPIKDRQGYLSFSAQFGSSLYDNSQFQERLNKIIEFAIESNQSKLVNAIYSKLEGLDVKSVNEIRSHIGKQGIEGTYEINLNDGTSGRMNTKSIFAGGYNIQVLHYRYLIGIDDSLKSKKVIEEDPLTHQEYEVKKIMKQMLPEDFDIANPIPPEVRQGVEQLPGASKNFSPLIKRGLMFKREYGNYAIKRYNYYLTPQGLNFVNQEDEAPENVPQDDKLVKHFEKQKEKYAKGIVSIFQDIKGRIKDWNTWLKRSLEESVRQGHKSKEEITIGQSEIDRLQKFINKYPYKRPEIYQKVNDREFKFSDFDEISDLFTDSSSDNYARLKRSIQRNEFKDIT